MDQPWEEALDLDDSDLPSLRPLKRRNHQTTASAAAEPTVSQPFLQRCSISQSSQTLSSQNLQNLVSQFHLPPSSSPRLIPGPAGNVQSAMLRRRKNQNGENLAADFCEEPIPTQEYIRKVMEDGVAEDDDDFTGDPWLCAVDFIRRQGLADEDGAIGIPLSVIKSRIKSIDKVAQDPTGTIDGTIHSRVLNDGAFGKDMSIGAAIILQKVAVFAPSRSAYYLNITLSNMVKVISKDCKLSVTQDCSAPVIKHAGPVFEHNEKSWMPQMPFSLSQGRTDGIMNSLRQNANKGGSSHNDQQSECKEGTWGRCSDDGNKENQNVDAGTELFLVNQNVANEAIEVANEMKDKEIKHSTRAGRTNKLEGAQCGSTAEGLIDAFNKQETGNVNRTNRRKPPTWRNSPPQWTDEQLDQLFEMD
ncbi:hypothetical protein MANES_14G171300v8 [Manihot esculenta]|uniref:Uncharacterized protein n=1 Tax=Manihot esculenta TaxID=3983 RepID=A0ACB7GHK4_MANES|nr:hypothetical protein MANES_14G171300v8 [Manihot esculenta]